MSAFFFFQAEDGIRDATVTGVQTCALPIWWLNQKEVRERGRIEQRSQKSRTPDEVAGNHGRRHLAAHIVLHNRLVSAEQPEDDDPQQRRQQGQSHLPARRFRKDFVTDALHAGAHRSWSSRQGKPASVTPPCLHLSKNLPRIFWSFQKRN